MAKGKHAKALFEVITENKRVEQQLNDGGLRTPRWFGGRAPVRKSPAQQAAAPKPVAVDPEHQEVSLRLSYTQLAIATFALVVVVGMAVYVGRHMMRGRELVIAPASSEQLRALPPQPSVLEVPPAPRNADRMLPALAVTPEAGAVEPAPTHGAAGSLAKGLPRQVGLNYVIAQTYPDEKSAEAARDALVQSGIDCTVEKGPPGWARMDWFSVIGTDGFVKLRAREYEDYVKSMDSVSAKFAGKSKFKRFEPRAFKWKG